VAQFGEEVVGYALIGRCRSGPGGEVQELYMRPDCQGLGFGARLFTAARAEFRARDMAPLTVWCLADNSLGMGFYRAVGGRETGRVRERVGGVELEKLRFTWT
jgi:GNAT superfamily N-acetyltransferase